MKFIVGDNCFPIVRFFSEIDDDGDFKVSVVVNGSDPIPLFYVAKETGIIYRLGPPRRDLVEVLKAAGFELTKHGQAMFSTEL